MLGLINSSSQSIPLCDRSVHCVVTSPPYYQKRKYSGDQGRHWPEVTYYPMAGIPAITIPAMQCELGLENTPLEFVGHIVQVFREVWRVLRDDGTAWVNFGDTYSNEGKNGGQSYGKNYTSAAGGYQEVRNNRPNGFLSAKNLYGIPWRVAFALQADGWFLRSDVIWSKGNPMPESVRDRPSVSHEYLFLLAKSARYYCDMVAIMEETTGDTHSRGKNINPPSDNGLNVDSGAKSGWCSSTPYKVLRRNKRTVWDVNTQPYAGAHFATFPPALVEPCIKAGTSEKGVCDVCGAPYKRLIEKGNTDHTGETESKYETGSTASRLSKLRQAARAKGGEYVNTAKTIGWQPTCTCEANIIKSVVLDPFAGSGTTLQVARALGRDAIGLDLSYSYLYENARKRLELDKLDAWENGIQAQANLVDLPLFGGI